MNQSSSGSLIVAAIDIGNKADIPRRTIFELSQSDIVICESIPEFKFFANNNKINFSEKTIIEFNEHISTPDKVINNLINFHKDGKKIILVSNQGTPLIRDPGIEIVRRFREEGLEVDVIPGPSAVIAALSICGLPTDNFYFAGPMSPYSQERIEMLSYIKNNIHTTVVILQPLFQTSYQAALDIREVFGDDIKMFVVINMTKTDQKSFFGSVKDSIVWLDEVVNSVEMGAVNLELFQLTYVIDNNSTIS